MCQIIVIIILCSMRKTYFVTNCFARTHITLHGEQVNANEMNFAKRSGARSPTATHVRCASDTGMSHTIVSIYLYLTCRVHYVQRGRLHTPDNLSYK